MQAKLADDRSGKVSQSGQPEQPLRDFGTYPLASWSRSFKQLSQGLSSDDAKQRLASYGANLLKPKKRSDSPTILLSQFKSPIILILIIAAGLSIFLGEKVNATIILTIVIISSLLSFWQERRATKAVQKLLGIVQIKVAVLRGGSQKEIPLEEVVPGDVVVIGAGDLIPGDCIILESNDLFVDEAALTGETYPVEKMAGVLAPETPLSQRKNALFMGTHAVSGSAKQWLWRPARKPNLARFQSGLKSERPRRNLSMALGILDISSWKLRFCW